MCTLIAYIFLFILIIYYCFSADQELLENILIDSSFYLTQPVVSDIHMKLTVAHLIIWFL